MYNGIGLTTARGSGTNGYIQTNKFFVRPKVGRVADNHGKGFAGDEGTAGVTRKPNKDILEHDRKRQIELKLVELEDRLIDQGLTGAVIALRLADARLDFEAAAEKSDSGALVLVDKRVSDTQSHQIAARKEKQMETLRAALGIRAEPEENADEIDDEPRNNLKMNNDMYPKSEHAFLDRDYRRKKDVEENQKSETEDKIKNSKGSKKRNKKKESRKRRHVDNSSDSDDSAGKSRVVKKKHHKSRRNDEDSDSDVDERRSFSKKHKKSKRSARDVSESESDSDSGSGSATSNDSDSSDTDGSARNLKSVEKKHQRAHKGSVVEEKKLKVSQRHQKSRKHGSEDSDSASSGDDDSRKKGSRKQVEKSNKSQTRRDTDNHDDYGSDEGLLKIKQAAKKGRRHDSEDDLGTDNEMEKKSNRDLEEREQKYKKSNRRHDSDSGGSDSEEGQIKEKQLARLVPRLDPESAREQNKSISRSKSKDQDDNSRQVRRSSPEENFGSLREEADYRRRKEDRYLEKNDNKDSGLARRGRDEVSDERRDRIRSNDEEPRRGSRNVDRDFDQRGGDRWRMRTEDDDEQRGRKHGRDEEDNSFYRGQRRRDDERDSERERQRDYPKRSRYDESRSGERTRRENERGDDRARRRD